MIYVKTRPGPDRTVRATSSGHRPLAAAVFGLALAVLAALAFVPPASAQPAQGQHLQAISLQAGMHLIHAEVAMTAEQRQIGLMNRRDLGSHDGMLFVFEEPAPQCFWMRNTPTPLAIAFVADDGTIVNLDEMKPLSDDAHCSTKPVRYVLEMNTGWFSKRGIKPGFKLGGGPFGPGK